MKRQTIRITIILGTIAVISIIIIQTYWMRSTFNINERQFNQTIHIALQKVAENLAHLNSTSLPNYNPVNQLSASYFVVNVNTEIDPKVLEFYLIRQFDSLKITTPFEYAIYDCATDKMMYGNFIDPTGKHNHEWNENYLPKCDEFVYYFGVYFPFRMNYLFSKMTVWLILSGILIITMIFFGYALFVILKQKRLSELQKDFINNMTHEFKTPISTINISANVLKDKKIINSPDRIKSYADIISQQNERLNHQVERVLQISRIEKRNFNLQKEKINLHDFLIQIARSSEIKINEKNGALNINLMASRFIVNADKVHLANIIYNLLDNATKYCLDEPEIEIITKNEANQLLLCINDRGIGIPKEYQKQVFRKFFRVPTGNVHNVKGFGLGLYYVKTICHAHKWKIKLESITNKGSKFCIFIPLKR